MCAKWYTKSAATMTDEAELQLLLRCCTLQQTFHARRALTKHYTYTLKLYGSSITLAGCTVASWCTWSTQQR